MKGVIEITTIVKVEKVTDGFLATCLDLPEIIAEFDSIDEMMQIMPELIISAIQARIKYDLELPKTFTITSLKKICQPVSRNQFVPISQNQYRGDICFQA